MWAEKGMLGTVSCMVRIDVSLPCCRAVVEEQHRMQGFGYFWGWGVVYWYKFDSTKELVILTAVVQRRMPAGWKAEKGPWTCLQQTGPLPTELRRIIITHMSRRDCEVVFWSLRVRNLHFYYNFSSVEFLGVNMCANHQNHCILFIIFSVIGSETKESERKTV